MDAHDIVDLSTVSPQATFLDSHPEPPSAASTLYLDHYSSRNADGSENLTVVGVHIVLEPGDPNGLWDAIHVDRDSNKLDPENPQVAMRSLQVCCDTLEVRGALSVPEAEVAIFARRLIWATDAAAIDTSPLDWALAKAADAQGSTPGQNGAAGRNAGSLSLYVSAVEPAEDPRPRLFARGGRGQDPGAGRDGTRGKPLSGYSRQEFSITDSWVSTSKATVKFDPVAVYIDYRWKLSLVTAASGKLGVNAFPTNGGDALAPGVPGDGGNGGRLKTCCAALAAGLHHPAGRAGTKARDYRGGPAGRPTSCAKYDVTLYENVFGTDHANYDRKKTASNTTRKGANAKALPAAHGDGDSPETEIIDQANAWLHPLGLQKTLGYARDLFLAGARSEVEELLTAYEAGLASCEPENGAWGTDQAAQWSAAQAEVAAMLQRLRGQLDYFGNAAGYTPLFSLQGTIKLYQQETRRALRTLLLVAWISARERKTQDAASALGQAIDSLNDELGQAAEQVVDAEARVANVTRHIDVLEQQLNDMSNRLKALRNELLTEAQGKLDREAQIKFGIHMAAALCQVIPVGQPALGSVGSLAGVAAGFIGDDASGAPDTVSKLGGVLTDARAASKKAAEAASKAAKEKGSAPAKDAADARAGASAWAQVGDGIGPALAQVSQGLQALQVPASEVEAELQRLESESEQWNALTGDIRELNRRKVALVTELVGALQAVSEGYGRISSNAAAVLVMHQERGGAQRKLNPAATACVRAMGQRARLGLLRYLYLMVKAYQATVFKPLAVDWKLAEVGDKINELLKPDEGFDAGSLNQQVQALEPLYQSNLDAVRNQLLDDFSFADRSMTLQLGLSRGQTPEVLAALNDAGTAVIDPVDYGLVLPDQQLAHLSDVVLTTIEFDADGPPLPETHNLVVSVQSAHVGTVRRSDALYSVYSDAPATWSWTCLAGGEVRPSTPSKGAQDMLDLVLGSGAQGLRQKVSLPPMWSDLTIKVAFSPVFEAHKRPRIRKLYFELGCDGSTAPERQCVLDVRSLGLSAGALIQCTPDLAARATGFKRMIRIFSQGARVGFSVPSHVGGSGFDAWKLMGRQVKQPDVATTDVELVMDDHLLAQCHWSRSADRVASVVLSDLLAPQDLAAVADQQQDEAVRRELTQALESRNRLTAAPPARDLLMRATASDDAPVIGMAPSLEDTEAVETGADGWQRVNYRGTVGWVNPTP